MIHHTDCGMLTFTNADLAQHNHDNLGVNVGEQDFLPFPDLEQSVRDDVAILRASPLIPQTIPIAGAVYDVRMGAVQELVRA